MGSPFNIVAGSQPDLRELKAHYKKGYAEAEAKRAERLEKRSESHQIYGHEVKGSNSS